MILALFPSLVLGRSEDPEPKRFEFRETHMGSEFTLLIYSNDADLASRAARSAFDRIASLDATLSDYRTDSELMRLCDQAGGPPVAVSPELFAILRRSRDLSERTEGAFDVTINPVVKLWRRARRNRELPSREQLDAALDRVGWEKMILDDDLQTVRFTQPGMRVDLGGIAKGFASDSALTVLRGSGITRALVAGAGDIVAGDPPPGRDAWTVGIAPLNDPNQAPERFLSLANQAVSTSGDAERFVEIDGVRYSHIVDPRTGLGLTGRSSVTVVSPDGTTSDSLATALSVLGPDLGIALAEQTEGAEALVLSASDGSSPPRSRMTSGFGNLLGTSPIDESLIPSIGGPES